MKRLLPIIVTFLAAVSCGKGSGSMNEDINLSVTDTPFTITDESQLIGGPVAHGKVGDILLRNDKIRVIIQGPAKYPQSCPFGGVIIDADIVRPEGGGQDNFGKMCSLVNIEWTVNYRGFQMINDGSDGGSKIIRAVGTIDVLDYLDLDFIAPVAKALTGQTMYFSPRYDDANDPFTTYPDLQGINTEVTTDYELAPGTNYIKMTTTFENKGGKDVYIPVGRFVNGSGQVQTLFPGLGFTPQPTAQITQDAAGIVYVPFEGVDVSYGYFYDLAQFQSYSADAVDAQKMLTSSKAEEGSLKRNISTSLTYSGVTGIILGEEFLKVLPLGGPTKDGVNFSIPAGGTRSIVDYFIVGDKNPATIFNTALEVLNIPTHKISGQVLDQNGKPVDGATVVVQNKNNMTVITYKTDAEGGFSGNLSNGNGDLARAFGDGTYKLFVEKQGYHTGGTNVAGKCDPSDVDITAIDISNIKCTLGDSATVELKNGVLDADSGTRIPVRFTIVGFDPSPDSQAGAEYATTSGAGGFEDTWIFERPWGIVDVKYVNIKGEFGFSGQNNFRLEPGHYAFVFSRGLEYEMVVKEFDVAAGAHVVLDKIKLKRVIKTPGWISGDFHLHSIQSPDSSISTQRRTLTSASEGMDVLQSSDHDWLVDYGPVISELEDKGIIQSGSLTSLIGDEISPNHYGHMNIFPLEYDHSSISGGSLDWTYSPYDKADPSPDYVMSPRDIIDYFNSGKGGSGEKVYQVNHLADQPTSLLVVSSWATTTKYDEITPLSSYVEPSAQRLMPKISTPSIPLPYGTSDLVVTDFTSLELTIGSELYNNRLRETGLPQWFNLLNLGVLVTGTGDSDSHREIVDQLGMPRNYVASSVDPKDGMGSFAEFNEDTFAEAINNHKVIVSAGPFVTIKAASEDGSIAGVGDFITGKKINLKIDVRSPAWAWFDTIEIYTNTEPLPADDDGVSVFGGVASDPKSFFAPYHVPKFYYEPQYIYTTGDNSLPNWKEDEGVISASVDVDLSFSEDTWIIVFVSGNKGVEGFRSTFPVVTKSIADPTKMKAPQDGWTLNALVTDPHMESSAWAFTNPIFVDVDGDQNNDGNPFEAIYIKNGLSPLAK